MVMTQPKPMWRRLHVTNTKWLPDPISQHVRSIRRVTIARSAGTSVTVARGLKAVVFLLVSGPTRLSHASCISYAAYVKLCHQFHLAPIAQTMPQVPHANRTAGGPEGSRTWGRHH